MVVHVDEAGRDERSAEVADLVGGRFLPAATASTTRREEHPAVRVLRPASSIVAIQPPFRSTRSSQAPRPREDAFELDLLRNAAPVISAK